MVGRWTDVENQFKMPLKERKGHIPWMDIEELLLIDHSCIVAELDGDQRCVFCIEYLTERISL